MKYATKNMLKALMIIALFCSSAFADGDMGGGGLIDCDNPGSAEEVILCTEEGDMGGGGRSSGAGYSDTTINSIYIFFDSMIREIL